MTAPPLAHFGGDTWWEDEGTRIAGSLHDAAAVLVVGTNPVHAARVALGIARAESERRHVALGDLVGELAPIYAETGGEDAFGLTDCLRQDLPLNDIARPAPGRPSLFILPAGSPPVASTDVISHERWPRLINGFAKAGALLLLVCEPNAPALATLAAAANGVVLVDMPRARTEALRVLGHASAPATQAPPRERTAGLSGFWRAFLAFGAVVLLAAAGWFAWKERATQSPALPVPAVNKAAAPVTTAQAQPATSAVQLADTVHLSDPVNPADTSSTVSYAVEVMAANTLAGANSFLSDNRTELSLATVSPVNVGGSTNVWYKVIVGASHGREGADSALASLRRLGVVRRTEGRVVKVPYALLVQDKADRSQAERVQAEWKQRGFNPYLLVQQDGSVRVLAGAFETMAEAAPLASALRAAGVAPVLTYRTGRTY